MKFFAKKLFSMFTLSAVLISSTVILKADASTDGVDYLKYTYGSYASPEEYSLYLEDSTIAAIQSRATAVEDNRQRDVHDGVVFLYTDITALGSGFIVGDHVIATAAHCVYAYGDSNHAATNYFIEGMKINLYDANGARQGDELTPIEVHVPKDYNGTGTEIGQKHDYALITVEEDLSQYTMFNLGTVYDTTNANTIGVPVFSSGYPKETSNFNNSQPRYLYTSVGSICDAPYNRKTHLLYNNTCISGGDSGGPVYTIAKYTVGSAEYTVYTAVSLCSTSVSSCNWGRRFDSYVLQFYLNNDYIEY